MYLTVYANKKGEIFEYPELALLGRAGNDWLQPEEEEMIPLPEGAALVSIPGFLPVGLDKRGELKLIENDPCCELSSVQAVAALLPQGFTRTLLPACVKSTEQTIMPTMGYAAVGFKDNQFYVAAVQSDEHRKWHPAFYNTDDLPDRISAVVKQYPHNRLIRQLAYCSLEYNCFTAQNLFYGRWEAGLPTFNKCNAACIGCISESHIKTYSPQSRLQELPSVAEIAEAGAFHLGRAEEGIISFGQGCEGEPALNAARIAPAIQRIRQSTAKGTININTNAGFTEGIKKICDAGLDSMRVTMFSAREKNYNYYHKPCHYSLKQVKESILYAKEKDVKVSLNLLVFPGFTDMEKEIEELIEFIAKHRLDKVQLRNLNIDPDILLQGLKLESPGLGIVNFLKILQQELPDLKIGSYSEPVNKYQ